MDARALMKKSYEETNVPGAEAAVSFLSFQLHHQVFCIDCFWLKVSQCRVGYEAHPHVLISR